MILSTITALDTQATVAVWTLAIFSAFLGIFAIYALKLDIKRLLDCEKQLKDRIDQFEEELKLQRDTKSKEA
jgi:hypothetical protein